MSWRSDSRDQKNKKEKLDREITSLVVSIHEAQAAAETVEEKTVLLNNLKKSLRDWLVVK